jgi:hypothetical protein
MEPSLQTRLIDFLQQELAVSTNAIAIALKQPEHSPTLLPTILWQYGFLSLDQLAQAFDWLESA